jgi:hypothetical protein
MATTTATTTDDRIDRASQADETRQSKVVPFPAPS